MRMLNVKDEQAISEYCHHRQKLFTYHSCTSCWYRDRSKEKASWEDCMFEPTPWRTKFPCDKPLDFPPDIPKELFERVYVSDHRNSITKTKRNQEVVDLYESGWKQSDISHKLGISYNMVTYIIDRYRRLKRFKEDYPEFYEAADILKMDEGMATKVIKFLCYARVEPWNKNSDRLINIWPTGTTLDIPEGTKNFGPKSRMLMNEARRIRLEKEDEK